MNQIEHLRQRLTIAVVLLVQLMSISLFSMPNTIYADTETEATPVVCPTVNGTRSPTGSAARTFKYNPETCLYENGYYTWDPSTKAYTPVKDADLRESRLNADGTALEYWQWEYSPAKGKYELRTFTEPLPVIASPAEGVTTSNSQAPQSGDTGASSSTTGGNAVSNTGAGSENGINSTNNTDASLSLINNTSVITKLDSLAMSGDAAVLQNTNGGSASTGDATAIANYLALIQSGWDPTSSALATFNADIYGSFSGDLLFDPDLILNTGDGSQNSINDGSNTNVNVVIQDNASINNDINLTAQSGNATVSENTNGGSASTGDAKAMANLINMINSSINSQNGFIGTINIHGNLDGDFLLPPALLAQLQSTGAGSNNSIQQNNNTNIDADITNNASIYNNFNIGAISGSAVVDQNTNAGDAITGNALTNVEQQNYVGINDSGQKGLLVFVNVMGQWVGFVNPNFATIGGTGAGSNNNIASNNNTNIDLDLTQDYSITNNINLAAQSGDATVSRNTNAGDAKSGDAFAGANVLNMIDSDLNYNDWFGVLFINVFGSWNGSFGTDTLAGSKNSQEASSTAKAVAEDQSSGRPSVGTPLNSGQTFVASRVAAAARMTGGEEEKQGVVSGTTSDSMTPPAISNQQPAMSSDKQAARGFVLNWQILALGAVLGAGFAMRKQDLSFIRAITGRIR